MNKFLGLAAVAALVVVPYQAQANASANIPFNGSVASTCVITVGSSGVLGVSADFDTLSSDEAGGAAGTASVLATGAGFSVRTTAPSAWTSAPPTGNTNVTFASAYSTSGPTSVSNVAGTTATPLNRGTHSVSVDMSATKTVAGDTFEAGIYAATVVLLCE